MHTLQGCRSLHLHGRCIDALELVVGENERTDGSVRTYERTLVTLCTVVGIPYRNEGGHSALLPTGRAVLPCTVDGVIFYEVGNLQQVASLSVDRTNEVLNECRSCILYNLIVGQVGPCRVDSKLLVLATAVNGRIVLVNNVLALLAVGLHDGLLHLLNGKVYRDNLRDAEERGLKDGVGTVAKTNLLCNLCRVDIVNGDVLLCEHTLNLVGDELDELITLEDGVEQERAVLADTTCDIVHVEICLNVACNEVRCGNLVCRADRLVAEAEV